MLGLLGLRGRRAEELVGEPLHGRLDRVVGFGSGGGGVRGEGFEELGRGWRGGGAHFGELLPVVTVRVTAAVVKSLSVQRMVKSVPGRLLGLPREDSAAELD